MSSSREKEALQRYRTMRAFDAKQERNRGKTAWQLVQECHGLDIDAIYKRCVQVDATVAYFDK